VLLADPTYPIFKDFDPISEKKVLKDVLLDSKPEPAKKSQQNTVDLCWLVKKEIEARL
tara:strand:+ start:517 stop:690 length:174 start_codon:yes stop_codon:yes gene_type:complete